MRTSRNSTGLLILPGLFFLAVTFVVPVVGVLLRSFDPDGRLSFVAPRFSLTNYSELLGSPIYSIIFQNTFLIAVIATVVTLILAYPMCYFLSRLSRAWAGALIILALFPFWTSILARLFAFTQILPQFGLMYTTTATIIGMVYYLLPYMIAILYANMAGIDNEVMNAARTLGASLTQALRRVFIPMTKSGVFVGATVVFVISLGFFLTPAVLGGGSDLTVATYIQQQVDIASWGTASAIGTVLLVLTLAVFFGSSRFFGSDELVVVGVGSQKGVARTEKLRFTWPIVVGFISTIIIFVFLLLPLIVVILLSFASTSYLSFPPTGFSWQWYGRFFSDADWLASAWLSLQVALLTAVSATLLGLITAIALERGGIPAKKFIMALFLAPLIVPAILTAVALFDLSNRLHLSGTIVGYVVGHTLLALPITVMIISTALSTTGTELEQAARTLGASRHRAFTMVTARMIAPSLGVAAIFAFVTSWDEPVVALFMSTGRTTLPVHIFNHMRTEVTPTIAAVSTVLMALVLFGTLAAYGISYAVRRRRLETGSQESTGG